MIYNSYKCTISIPGIINSNNNNLYNNNNYYYCFFYYYDLKLVPPHSMDLHPK